MPVTYSIDTTRRMIRTTCSGAVTLTEVIEHFRSLSADPVCSGHLDVLLDVSQTDSLPESRQLGAVSAELGADSAEGSIRRLRHCGHPRRPVRHDEDV